MFRGKSLMTTLAENKAIAGRWFDAFWGKRSDPDFKPTTLLLREKTKRAAMRLLEDNGRGQDLSELVEQLLTQWNKRQG